MAVSLDQPPNGIILFKLFPKKFGIEDNKRRDCKMVPIKEDCKISQKRSLKIKAASSQAGTFSFS